MDIQILFHTSSTPKEMKDVEAVYTKGDLLCVRQGEWIYKWPLANIFQIAHKHGPHWGSREFAALEQERYEHNRRFHLDREPFDIKDPAQQR
jgi:hypothetical protein